VIIEGHSQGRCQHKIGYETILLQLLRDKSATCKSPEMKA
jgi:hypothetical protein